jgi:hypothetical protein
VRTSDCIVLSYCAYLSACALVRPVRAAQRVRVWLASAAIAGLIVTLARVPQTSLVAFARDWLPGAYILAAYYMTGVLIVRPNTVQEAWLRRCDATVFRGVERVRLPRPLRAYLEVAYNGCVLLMPFGFAVLTFVGSGYLADRYWSIVLTAELLAFASLPWFQTRPPWIVENVEAHPDSFFQRTNLFWLRRTSVRMNTFPSGHASGSLAVALVVASSAPLTGAVLAVVAISVAAGSVFGRYHYAIDAAAGLLLACAVWGMAAAVGF